MVIRLGRNGKFVACSTYPDHKETHPLPGQEQEELVLPGTGGPCPECGEGVLAAKRGRFGPFVGCNRYPDCKYIQRDGPPPPDQLPFEVACPKDGKGHLVARRVRRTGNVFWGCSGYPRCDFTTNFEPVGAAHEGHDEGQGSIVKQTEGGLCLTCGSAVELPEGDVVGRVFVGGPANPEALVRPARRGRGGSTGGRKPAAPRKTASAGTTRARGTKAAGPRQPPA